MDILLAINFSPRSQTLIKKVAEGSWPPDTTVRILAGVDNSPPSAFELWFDAAGSLDAVMEARKERSRELAERAAAVLRDKGLKVETRVQIGSSRRIIAFENRKLPPDVILK